MNATQTIEIRRGRLRLGTVTAAEAVELLREGFFRGTDQFYAGDEGSWHLLGALEVASSGTAAGIGAKVSAAFSQAAAAVKSQTASAAATIGNIAGRGKQGIDNASHILLEDFLPRMQTMVGDALVNSSTTVASALRDEVFLKKLFGAIYDVLPKPVHRFVGEETFIAFSLKHRDRLLAGRQPRPSALSLSTPMQLIVGIITVSDRASQGLYDDLGGPAVKNAAEGYGWRVEAEALVPDEVREIQRMVRELINKGCNLVLTTGGTGVALRDVTPEAVREIATRELPGFGEVIRMESMKITQNAILSRNLAVVVDRALVVCLPGKPSGAVECLGFVVGAIPHCVEVIQEVPTSC
jgi:molybdopterin adenylyltransferase